MVLLLFACLVCSHEENTGDEKRDALTGATSDPIKKASASSVTTVAPSPNHNSNGNGSQDSEISEQKLDIESGLNTRPLYADLNNDSNQTRMQTGEKEGELVQNFSSPNRTSSPSRIHNVSVPVSREGLETPATDNETRTNHSRVLNENSEDSLEAQSQLQSEVAAVRRRMTPNVSNSERVPNRDSTRASKQTNADSGFDTGTQANYVNPMQDLSSQGEEFNMSNPSLSDAAISEKEQPLYSLESHKNQTTLADSGESPLIEYPPHEGSNSSKQKVPLESSTNTQNNTKINVGEVSHKAHSTTPPMQIKPTEPLPAVDSSVNNTTRSQGVATPLTPLLVPHPLLPLRRWSWK